MADLTYQATLDDKISPALAKIQQQTKKTADAFAGLKTALGSIAFGAAIQSALNYADAISDIADATELSIASVVGFSKVVSAAGGNADKAQAAMVRFNLSLGDAANGGLAAQAAFNEVGITLSDLRTLSEQDLFNQVLKGLGGIDDVSKRARLQNELLGKSLRGVNLKDITRDYAAATAASQKYADDIKKAADLQDRLGAAYSKFKLEVLKAIEPLVNFVNNLKPEQIEKFIEAVVKIGGLAASLSVAVTVVSKLSGWLAAAGTAALGLWATFAGGAAQAGATIAGLGIRWGGFIAGITAAVGITAKFSEIWTFLGNTFTKTIPYLVGGILRMLGPLGIAIGVVQLLDLAIKAAFDFSPVDWFTDKVSKAYRAFREFIGLRNEEQGTGAGAGRGGNDAITKQLQDRGEEMRRQSEEAKAKLKIEREAQDALAKQRREIALISVEFKKQLDTKANQIALETSLIGKSERQRELATALADLTQKTTDEVDKLTKAKQNLTDAEKQLGLAADYDRQIAAVKQLGAAEQQRLTNLVDGLVKAKALEEFRLYGIKQQQDAEDKLLAIQRQIADIGLTDIEKGYRDIARAADDSAKAAIRAEEARRGASLSAAEIEAYYQKAREGVNDLVNAQKRLNDSSRTFAAGWRKAFNDYADSATNAAAIATRVFEKFTSGLEDAIVGFVKTGKFEWKKFVGDMAEELLRAQIKQTIASFGQAFGLGSLFGGGGGMGQGQGSSPTNPLYVLDISGGGGSAGGGIFGGGGGIFGNQGRGQQQDQGGGIFGSIGKVFGGVVDTAKSVFGGIGDAIGSIFGGGGGFGTGDLFGNMDFGGFFANGGTIPRGKYGIVGESGPEMIGGPATVTPLGSTNVTYNIQAVDAASFQALVARDPGFIHAVAMAGAKSVPQRR